MVIAVTALVVALSGSAYALTIANANVRDRSLTGTKFQENSVGGSAIKESALSGPLDEGTLFQLHSVGGNAFKESTLDTGRFTWRPAAAGQPRCARASRSV
jgi:hypothetical protein